METKIKLTNSFHRTEAYVIPKNNVVMHQSAQRAFKKLCGMKDCCCGETRDSFYDLEQINGRPKSDYIVVTRTRNKQ